MNEGKGDYMKDAKKSLKSYSWVYFILALLTVILIVANFIFPEVAQNIVEAKFNGADLKE